MRNEMAQASSQYVLCQSQIPLELAKTLRPIERITNDEQRPVVAYDVQWPRHSAHGIFV